MKKNRLTSERKLLGCPRAAQQVRFRSVLSTLKNMVIANRGKGNPSYLTANVYEELIALMGDKVLLAIVNEVLTAKHYSISVDSTPDVSHVDQLTFTVRYVKECDPVERFLQFIPVRSHGAENLADVVIKFLQDNGIPRIAEDRRTTTRRTWLDATRDYRLESELLIPWHCLIPVQYIRLIWSL